MTSERTVRNAMTTTAVTVRPGTSARAVAVLLETWRLTAAPVVDDRDRVLGVVSQADLSGGEGMRGPWRSRRTRRRVAALTAGQLMTAPAVTVRAEADVTEAARLLTEHEVARLPVVDIDGRLAGVISRSDVLRVFLPSDDPVSENGAEIGDET
jgi:CBS-domain-containing membrane protein